MRNNNKWNDLKTSLKTVLDKISISSKKHLVSIINFSSEALLEYINANPNQINISSLNLMGKGTDFGKVLTETLCLLQNDKSNLNVALIFMTDGEAKYPENEIKALKTFIENNFKTKTFKFYGLGFECKNETLGKITQEFGGESQFANDGQELKNKYCEIFTKSLQK